MTAFRSFPTASKLSSSQSYFLWQARLAVSSAFGLTFICCIAHFLKHCAERALPSLSSITRRPRCWRSSHGGKFPAALDPLLVHLSVMLGNIGENCKPKTVDQYLDENCFLGPYRVPMNLTQTSVHQFTHYSMFKRTFSVVLCQLEFSGTFEVRPLQ